MRRQSSDVLDSGADALPRFLHLFVREADKRKDMEARCYVNFHANRLGVKPGNLGGVNRLRHRIKLNSQI